MPSISPRESILNSLQADVSTDNSEFQTMVNQFDNFQASDLEVTEDIATNDQDIISYINKYPKYLANGDLITIGGRDEDVPPASPNYVGLINRINAILQNIANKDEAIDYDLDAIGYNRKDELSVNNRQLNTMIALGFLFAYIKSYSELKATKRDISNRQKSDEISLEQAMFDSAAASVKSIDFDTSTTPTTIREFIIQMNSAFANVEGVTDVNTIDQSFVDPMAPDSKALKSWIIALMRSMPEYFELTEYGTEETYVATQATKSILMNNKSLKSGLKPYYRIETNATGLESKSKSKQQLAIDYLSSCPWKASKGSLNAVVSMLISVMSTSQNLIQTGYDQTIFNGLSVSVSDHPYAEVFGMDKMSLVMHLNSQRPNDVPYVTIESLPELQTSYSSSMQWVELAVDAMNTVVATNINPLFELLVKKDNIFYFAYDSFGYNFNLKNVTNSINLCKSPILRGLVTTSAVNIVNPKSNGMVESEFKKTVVRNLNLMLPNVNFKSSSDKMMVDMFDMYFGTKEVLARHIALLDLPYDTKKFILDKRKDLIAAATALSGFTLKPDGGVDVSKPRMSNFVVDTSIPQTYLDQILQTGRDPKYAQDWMQPVSQIAKTTKLAIIPELTGEVSRVLELGNEQSDNNVDLTIRINTLVNVGSYMMGTPFDSDLVSLHHIKNVGYTSIESPHLLDRTTALSNPETSETGHYLIDGDYTTYFNEQSIDYLEQAMEFDSRHSDEYKAKRLAVMCLKAIKYNNLEQATWKTLLIESFYGGTFSEDKFKKSFEDNLSLYENVIERITIESKKTTGLEALDSLTSLVPDMLSSIKFPLDPLAETLKLSSDYVLNIDQLDVFDKCLYQPLSLAGVNLESQKVMLFANTKAHEIQSSVFTFLYMNTLLSIPYVVIANALNDINKKHSINKQISAYFGKDYIYSSFANCMATHAQYNQSLMKLAKMSESNAYATALKLRQSAETQALNTGLLESAVGVVELIESLSDDDNVIRKQHLLNKKLAKAISDSKTMPARKAEIMEVYNDKINKLNAEYNLNIDNELLTDAKLRAKSNKLKSSIAHLESKLKTTLKSVTFNTKSMEALIMAYENMSHSKEYLRNQARIQDRATQQINNKWLDESTF